MTRARTRSWKLFGLGYLGLIVAACGLVVADRDPWLTLGGFAIIFAWIGGFIHALTIRSAYLRLVESPEQTLLEAAEARVRVRENALRLVRDDPVRAKALGVGRPDIQLAFDGGLVDVNSAPADVIARLPHADERLAERIVTVRDRVGGFSSVRDLGLVARSRRRAGPARRSRRLRLVRDAAAGVAASRTTCRAGHRADRGDGVRNRAANGIGQCSL